MGSGKKLELNFHMDNFWVGIAISRFPHSVSVNIGLTFMTLYIGFGKGYDQ